MTQQEHAQKPGYEEWLHWSQTVIDRYSTAVGIYKNPPHEDIFAPESERQKKMAELVSLVKRIHVLMDNGEAPAASLIEMIQQDEKIIEALGILLKEALGRMPGVSTDMQKLLKSPWFDKCNGRLANELFRGPGGNQNEGIGSGHAEHGRLPAVLTDLFEREQVGDGRPLREQPAGDKAHKPEEVARRWGKENSSYLRSAGRVS